VECEDIISRISKVIDKVISEDEAFKEIDKTKLLKELSEMIGEINLHQVSDDELYIRIKKLVLELVELLEILETFICFLNRWVLLEIAYTHNR
jgi:hypothetical protein